MEIKIIRRKMDLDYRFCFFFLNYCLDCSRKRKFSTGLMSS